MSAVFSVSPVGLVRAGGVVSAGTDFSLSGRFYVSAVPANPPLYNTIIYRGDDPVALYAQYVWIGTLLDGALYLSLPGTPDVAAGVLSLGWHSLVYTYNQATTTHRVYVDSSYTPQIVHVQNINAWSFTHEYIGTDTYADWQPGKAAYLREWNVVLSDEEANREPVSPTIVRTSNVWLNTPLASNLLDISGNNRHWSPYCG